MRRAVGSAVRAAVVAAVLAAACSPRVVPSVQPDAPSPQAALYHPPNGPTPEGKEERPRPPQVPCPVADRQDVDAALDEAARRYERSDYLTALACAEQAAHAAPRSVEAHHDRADALAALEREGDAKLAYTMALALDPEDPQTLASAADFYINRATSDHDMALIGLEYARRGSAHVGRRRDDRELAARLALLEAEALDDLGRADEALARAESAVAHDAKSNEARYERALILFHLCKLDKARAAFVEVLKLTPDDPFAHHHLGLILEREGKAAEAAAHLLRAQSLAPTQFPAPVMIDGVAFRALVDRTVESLDPATRSLVHTVKIETPDLPEMSDLIAVDPPFPPTILGLFRGGGPKEDKSIVLYRKNLGRAVATPAELEKQVRITLLHELGHLTGADEDELRQRGFE